MLRGLALTCATLALAFVACGDGDDEEFRDDYDAVSVELRQLGEDVQAALQAAEEKSDSQLAKQFHGFARELAEIQGDLAGLEPPSDVEDEVEKLDGAIGDVVESLDEIADASGRGDARAARTATLALIQRGERLDNVDQAVELEARD